MLRKGRALAPGRNIGRVGDGGGLPDVDVRVLGPVELAIAGELRDVGGPRQRALLAALALEPGKAVAPGRLVDLVWPRGRPATAETTLYSYVTRLRGLLGDAGRKVDKRSSGYVLEVPPESVDAVRFEHAFDASGLSLREGDAEGAARLLDNALDLWRGSPYDDLADAEGVAPQRERLAAMRIDVLERLAEARLLSGRHREVAPDLRMWVEEHPERPFLTGALMIALYWNGKRSDALSVYASIGERVEEPDADDVRRHLHALHVAVEDHDDVLDEPASPRAVSLIPSASIRMATNVASPPSAPSAPSKRGPEDVAITTLARWATDEQVREQWPRDASVMIEILLAGDARQEVVVRVGATATVRDVTDAIVDLVRPGDSGSGHVLFSDRLGHMLEPAAPLPTPTLRSGDRLALMSVGAAEAEAQRRQTADPVATMLVVAGPATGVAAPVPPGTHVVGRRAPLTVRDDAVSARHFRVAAAPGHLEVADLGSTNGTFVRGRRVEGAELLQPGDVVEAGASLITFLDPAASPAEPVRLWGTSGTPAALEDLDDQAAIFVRALRDEVEAKLNHPTAITPLTALVGATGSRAWDGARRDEPVEVRIGWGEQDPTHRLGYVTPRHRESIRAILDDQSILSSLPVLVTLGRRQTVVVTGPREEALGLARWMIVQLCCDTGPADLEVACFADDVCASDWTWLAWLPHFRSLTPVAAALERGAKGPAGGVHRVAVVDVQSGRPTGPVALDRLTRQGLVLAIAEHVTDVSGRADLTIRIRPDSSATVESAKREEVAAAWNTDGLPRPAATAAARGLARRAASTAPHTASVSSTKRRDRKGNA